MTMTWATPTNPVNNRKIVIILQTSVSDLTCQAKEKGTTGQTYIIDLTTGVGGYFFHYPKVGEEWVIAKIANVWALERRTGLQNKAAVALQAVSPGDTVFNTSGALNIVDTNLVMDGTSNLNINAGKITVARPGLGGSKTVTLNVGATTGKTWVSDNDTSTDTWGSFTTTATIQGTTGVLNGEYRMTYDRWVEVRFQITWSVATTVSGNLVVNSILPTAIRPAVPPTYGIPYAYGSYSTNLQSGSARSTPNTGQLVAFSVPTGLTSLTASINYTMDKPTN